MAGAKADTPPAFEPATVSLMDSASPSSAGLDVAVFGAPLDATQSFRFGAADGPRAVRELSASLETYSPVLDRDVDDLALGDLGDLVLEGLAPAAALGAIEQATTRAASLGERVLMLGGEHTVTLAAYRAIKALHPETALVQLDAHLDLREQYEGQAITHASWLYHAGSEHRFDEVFQLGVRSGAREEWPMARDRCRFSSRDLMLPEDLRDQLRERPVYLTIDIDVLDPAAAPGTGCLEPGGPTFAEVERFVQSLDGTRIVAADVVEVSPRLDPSGATAAAAAKLVREVVLLGPGESTPR
ncbi:MAG: agmatinase [Actinomycetota bacterium]|nr:agmatinase [Actinomycetota bacterium]